MQARSNDGGRNNNTDNGGAHSLSQKHRVDAIKSLKNKLKKFNQKIAAAKSELESLPDKNEITTKVAKVHFKKSECWRCFGSKKSKSEKSEVFGALFWISIIAF